MRGGATGRGDHASFSQQITALPFNLRQRAGVLELHSRVHPPSSAHETPRAGRAPTSRGNSSHHWHPGMSEAAVLMLMGMKVSGEGRLSPAAVLAAPGAAVTHVPCAGHPLPKACPGGV